MVMADGHNQVPKSPAVDFLGRLNQTALAEPILFGHLPPVEPKICKEEGHDETLPNVCVASCVRSATPFSSRPTTSQIDKSIGDTKTISGVDRPLLCRVEHGRSGEGRA